MKKLLMIFCAVTLFFGLVGNASALLITQTIGEYSSPYWTGTNTTYDVGIFNYDLQGESIISATISGQWGNTANPTTAHNFLTIDGVEVADTHDYSPSPYTNYYTDWSYDFTDFSVLSDGIAAFSVTQTSEYVVRLAMTSLTIETAAAPVPEPSTILLMGAGLLGLVGYNRKRFRKMS